LKSISRTPSLVGLTARSAGDVGGDDFDFLSDARRIRRLQISGNNNADNRWVQAITGCDRLVSLMLQGSGIDDEGLLRLPMLPDLEDLNLQSTSSRGRVLQRVSPDSLTHVNINNISDDAMRRLCEYHQLTHVSLRSPRFSPPHLADLARCRWIVNLYLQDASDFDDETMAAVGKFSRLRYLTIRESHFGIETCNAIARLNSLRDLHVAGPDFDDSCMQALCGTVSLNQLTIEDSDNRLTDAALQSLWRLVNLRSLTIQSDSITPQGLAILTELPNLQRLQLRGRAFREGDLQMLQKTIPEVTVR
ncbi:MAG: hypothetical protein AAFP69_20000, partial [Planctomycetota bacterium]